MNEHFIGLMQRRIGSTSVGASTARGMGPKGTIQAARAYLQALDLRRFAVSSQLAFQTRLDEVTEELRAALPESARYWGSARKFLNIFLRGCFYNRYLYERYQLHHIERWLELPLDSHVAKGLGLKEGADGLPEWKSVISLTRKQSEALQAFAQKIAATEQVARIHLDLIFWRASAPNPSADTDASRR